MWNFFIPTMVYFGSGVVEKHAKFSDCGSKALLITGKRSARVSGALHDVTKRLVAQGIAFELFDEIEENPSFKTVEKGAEFLRLKNCDFVVGIGGGSPIDAAKAIAILGANPELKAYHLYSKKVEYSLPVVAIPLTSGTGSEVTQYSVLTDKDGNKQGFSNLYSFPKYSFLDPRYTLTMPEELTISTALDALSHAIEGELLNNGANPLVKKLSFEATRLIRENLPCVLNEPENLVYREKLQYAAMLAGMVIAHTGTTIVHAAGYPLSSKKGIKHGMANAVFLVDVLASISERAGEQVKNCIEPFENLSELSKFFEELGTYKIRLDMDESELIEWSEKAAKAPHNRRTPGEFDRAFYENLYKKLKKDE
ncbi:iron-containing alcohol dehydrogenase family protein [Kosmotoga pacifica]|uniref:Alcohol dehydrogenase n=1 Tax=Kosmotoga pacifica TaxID=1330330 RepID=A0A0G2ZA96_9BACT|nr:iron-containing alcohol dehydrogenase family protein [Kosmotoga pacifica]AKI97006.1 alcohol dehydrogenase [Kosmotoga pacifica]